MNDPVLQAGEMVVEELDLLRAYLVAQLEKHGTLQKVRLIIKAHMGGIRRDSQWKMFDVVILPLQFVENKLIITRICVVTNPSGEFHNPMNDQSDDEQK